MGHLANTFDEQQMGAFDELFRRQLAALHAGRILFPPVAPENVETELRRSGIGISRLEFEQLQGGASIEAQAGILLELLLAHLETNSLTPCMRAILAEHLRAEQVRSGKNPAAMKVLGIAKPSRPRSKLAKEDAATHAFCEAIAAGQHEQDAIRSAYDAYWELYEPPSSHAKDQKVLRAGKHPSLAHQRLEVIRAVLVKRGLLAGRAPGRPRKSK